MTTPEVLVRRGLVAVAILGSLLAGVGAMANGAPVEASPRTLPPVDEEQVGWALAGVAMFGVDDITGTTDGTCPLVQPDRVSALLAEQGIAERTGDYAVGSEAVDALGAVTVQCGVPLVAAEASADGATYTAQVEALVFDDDTGFMSLAEQIGAAVVPSPIPGLEGEVASACYTPSQQNVCLSAWHRDGLAISVHVAGPLTGELSAQVDAILATVAPEVIAGLAAYAQTPSPGGTLPEFEVPQIVTVPVAPTAAPTTAAPGSTVTTAASGAGDVEGARLGVSLAALAATGGAGDMPCPIVPPEAVAQRFAEGGLAVRSDGYVVGADAWTDIDVPYLYCGTDIAVAAQTPDPAAPFAVELQAMSIDDPQDFAALLGLLGGTVTGPDAAGLGGEIGGGCSAEAQTLCFVGWHSGGLVVSAAIVGPLDGIDQPMAEHMLMSFVPDAVANLAAYGVAHANDPLPTIPGVSVTSPAPSTTPLLAAPTTATTTGLPTAPPSNAVAPSPTEAAPASTDPPPGGPSEPTRLGITRFALADLAGGNEGVCPIVPQAQIEESMNAKGWTPRTAGYTVGTYDSPVTRSTVISCGVPIGDAIAAPDQAAPYASRIEAVYLDGDGTFDDLIADTGATITNDSVAGTTDQIASWCGPSSDNPAVTSCTVHWRRGDLVFNLFLVGPAEDLRDDQAEDLLVGLVLDAVENLSAIGDSTLTPELASAAATGASNADAATLMMWYAPGSEAARQAIDSTFVIDGPGHVEMVASEQYMVDGGFAGTPDPTVPYSFVAEDVVMLDSNIADVTVCTVDSTHYSDTPDAPIASYRARYTVVLSEGAWKLWQFKTLEIFDGEASCSPTTAPTISVPATTIGL